MIPGYLWDAAEGPYRPFLVTAVLLTFGMWFLGVYTPRRLVRLVGAWRRLHSASWQRAANLAEDLRFLAAEAALTGESFSTLPTGGKS